MPYSDHYHDRVDDLVDWYDEGVLVAERPKANAVGSAIVVTDDAGNERVNVTVSSTGTLLSLSDTPSSYSGQSGKYVKVKGTEDGVEFDTPAGSGDMTKAVYDTDDDGIVDKAESIDDGAGNAKTAAEVKAHIDSSANPHSVSAAQAGAEASGAVATHSALTTGVHGVGAGTVAKTSDITATKLDDFAAPDDNTDLDASGVAHGLMPKADKSKLDGIESGATADQTGAEIKTAYEGEADTNAFTDAEKTKLAGIEPSADITDATNVNAAGATMNADTDVKANGWVIDEDNMASDLDTKVPTQQSVKAYADLHIAKSLLTTLGDIIRRGAATVERLAIGTSGQRLTVVSGQPAWADDVATINFIIDGGGSVITTGIKGDIVVDYACTIEQVTALADQSGSIVVDIWKDSYANFPPTDADSITASAPPTISSAIKSQDSTLTGWTKSIAAGEVLRFNVDSVSTIERCTISLKVAKT